MQGGEKRYDPNDTTLKFVNRPDDLDPLPPEDGDISLRAEMSCGHAVTPESLTGWCRSLVDQGQYKFLCPALKNGTLEKCDALWPYQEVRRLAVLSAEEMLHFEGRMARLAAAEYCEFKDCPGCKTLLEREDLTNLSVQCTVCTADKKQSYEFCWQCLKPWKGPHSRSDRCDNDGCVNHDLESLKNALIITLPDVPGVECPSLRACPTCGQKQEHQGTACKNIICHRCKVEFCFVCLKLTSMCSGTDGSYFRACSAGVAPIQTSIPVWHRN